MLENLSRAPCWQKSRIRQSTLVRRLLKKMRPCKKDFWRETDRRSVIAAFFRSIEPRQSAIGIRNIAAVTYIIVHGRLASRLPSGTSRVGADILAFLHLSHFRTENRFPPSGSRGHAFFLKML